MSGSNRNETNAEVDVETVLAPRLERLRGLRSAWGVLAPAGLSDNGFEIGEFGRTVTETLATLTRAKSPVDPDRLGSLDQLLDDFETSMRQTASRVPVPELRSTLPGYVGTDRRGLLDLLDVFIGSEVECDRSSDGRIFAIDYLITLLCTSAERPGHLIRHDPVRLTPRLESLCAHAEAIGDPALPDVVAEFFAASNMDAGDLRAEFQQRRLRSRKAELGISFFAPLVLRAIVTYNAALFARVADSIIDSGDWGFSKTSEARTATATPLYESKPLRAIAAAVRRRAQGGEPAPEAADRIAWALDFENLEDVERKALCSEALGTRRDPLGTVILVGLICRSLAVLSIDLQDMGIAPDEVSDDWVAQLTETFQTEINENIANHDYKVACALSELKDRFLFAPLEEHLREKRVPVLPTRRETPSARVESRPTRESARDLVRNALEENRGGNARARADDLAWAGLPWVSIGRVAVAILALVVGVLLLQSRIDPDLDRLDRDELATLSPYLTDGRRDGEGLGRAFVGTIADEWLELPSIEREASAEAIVIRLQDLGVEQIMIYDDDRTLRIQALGSQAIRTL